MTQCLHVLKSDFKSLKSVEVCVRSNTEAQRTATYRVVKVIVYSQKKFRFFLHAPIVFASEDFDSSTEVV